MYRFENNPIKGRSDPAVPFPIPKYCRFVFDMHYEVLWFNRFLNSHALHDTNFTYLFHYIKVIFRVSQQHIEAGFFYDSPRPGDVVKGCHLSVCKTQGAGCKTRAGHRKCQSTTLSSALPPSTVTLRTDHCPAQLGGCKER